MRVRLQLVAVAAAIFLASACGGRSALDIKPATTVNVTVRCTPDSTYIAVVPSMAGISKQSGSIDFVLDQSSSIDSISIVPQDSTPFNSSGPINGKKGSNGKGSLKSGAKKGDQYKYQIIGACQVGTDPVKHIVIDPEMIIVD